MKLKSDFVTNSSSTSFFFIFNGDIHDFYKSLLENKDLFDLASSFDYNVGSVVPRCNVTDIIEEIDFLVRSTNEELMELGGDEWGPFDEKPEIRKLCEYIETTNKSLDDYINYTKNNDTLGSNDEFVQDSIKEQKEQIDKLIDAKESGFENILEISFGDNEGTVSGPMGSLMDYEGRNIDIKRKNLIIFTEQNR